MHAGCSLPESRIQLQLPMLCFPMLCYRDLQAVAASALAELMASCTSRQPSPNDKLVKNLCTMACGDSCETPCAAAAEGLRCVRCCVLLARRLAGQLASWLLLTHVLLLCACLYACCLLQSAQTL
jgi:hypothetical protein